jgi:predicted GIY-YIG superfamily endonuclease
MELAMNTVCVEKQDYTPNPSKFWLKRDEGVNKFFVYILLLDNGKFYVGHTRELLERMLEHRNGISASTAGRNPKLQYFETQPTRVLAMMREHEIKKILKNNRREIYRIISTFRELISLVDLN